VSNCPTTPNTGGGGDTSGGFGFNAISQVEKDVFEQQNKIRTDPKSMIPYL
jgi:hypothetical protein